MDYAAHAWLFVRGEESIRMTTKPTGGTLLIFGPGEANQSYDFLDAAALRTFLESYQERLLNDGWVLAIVAERRQPDRETAPLHERRARERRSGKPV
jgi:hypothetical protein